MATEFPTIICRVLSLTRPTDPAYAGSYQFEVRTTHLETLPLFPDEPQSRVSLDRRKVTGDELLTAIAAGPLWVALTWTGRLSDAARDAAFLTKHPS